MQLNEIVTSVLGGKRHSLAELEGISVSFNTKQLMSAARTIRDAGFGSLVTYSPKVFIPLTELCRDVCHYCTFAKVPKKSKAPFMTLEEVLDVAERGKKAGCKEALFTLGERPEDRYSLARDWLASSGYGSTIEYLKVVAGAVLEQTGLLPHINAGTMTADDMAELRKVAPSMGIMLETSSSRLSEKGMPHYGSPDKAPERRLETIRIAGELRVPMTSGILIGIGETETERLESILALRDLHVQYGHLQEIIVQNFRAKPDTRMAAHPEPSKEDLLRTIALARIAMGPHMSIQAPPNLSSGLAEIVDAGINDWGGISPVTPDHVNPEAPWPEIEKLTRETQMAAKSLAPRLTIYPRYVQSAAEWIDPAVRAAVLRLSDAAGLARDSRWGAGGAIAPDNSLVAPLIERKWSKMPVSTSIRYSVNRAALGHRLDVGDLAALFDARDADLEYICRSADELRQAVNGDTVSYVVTRNINYTNICTYGCKFCAFSKGKTHEALRGTPYDITAQEIVRRTLEAWERGATEVCLQGGIHPEYTGQTYIDICKIIKATCPGMHIHAFSPLEVSQGAKTLGVPVAEFLGMLKEAGLGSLPGTAAEILSDDVRAIISPDKLNTAEWVEVIEAAHGVGLKTTSTIMYGHVESYIHWAKHLLVLRDIQEKTGGISEFVPLPFVAQEAPIYLKGASRPGPTLREAVLMHAVARLALNPVITNIQTSWVKMGPVGVKLCMNAGVNDLGGTLMNESITKAAGAIHGQEASPEVLEQWIREAGRSPRQRTTLYGSASPDRQSASYLAPDLLPVVNAPYRKRKQGLFEEFSALVH